MTEVVIDSSAVLADINDEPGADAVRAVGAAGVISAVNFTEVITKLIEWGFEPDEARYAAQGAKYECASVDQPRAAAAGMLHARTRGTGVSLGDRYCLALAEELSLPVLTADRRWKTLNLGIEITLIR